MTTATPRVDRALADLAAGLRECGLPCRGALPTPAGDLLLVLAGGGPGDRVLVSTRPKRAFAGLQAPFGDLHLRVAGTGDDRRALLDRTAAALSRLRAGGAATWLDLHNREHGRVPPNAAGLGKALAWAVAPDVPFWDHWRLASLEDLPGDRLRVGIALSDGGEPPAMARLVLDAEGRLEAGERALAVTPLGVLARVAAQGTDGTSDGAPPPDLADAALALVLALSVPPTTRWATGWVPPGPRAEGPDGVAQAPAAPPRREDDSLIVHSYRTDHEWHLPRSRFFAPWGDRDFFILSALLSEPATSVFHGNRECQQVRQPLSNRFSHGVTPWTPRRRGWAWMVHRTLFTDTDDDAAVFGGEGRLEDVLQQQLHDAPGQGIRVLSGCDCHVVGDDVPAVCRGFADRGQPVSCFNPPLPRFTHASGRNWWEHFLQGRDRGVAVDPAAVNLAGLAGSDQPALAELQALLASAGIRTAAWCLPGQSDGFGAAVGTAAVTVASPWFPVQDVLVPVLQAEGLAVASPDAPYGVDGTRRWLDAVAAALGRAPLDDAAWDAAVRAAFPDLAGLRGQAGALTAGLFADRGTLAEMCGPRTFFGFDPVRVLLDLGFRVRAFGRAPDDAAALYADLPAADRARVSFQAFEPGDPLAPAAAGLDLVYCDREDAAEPRAAGLTPFGIGDLEPGLPGARRSLLRLLARSRLALYRRYGRFLEAPHG